MSIRKKFAGGAMVLMAGKAIFQASGLVRTVIVAGVIGAANMGIAATFTLTIGFLEAISAVSAGKFLVQDREGDSERMQGSVHSVQIIRSLFLAIAIFLVAEPVAHLFNAPEATNAYRLLAIVPLLRGLQHLDQKRVQRDMRYVQNTIVTTLPAVLMLVAAYPVAIWLSDYRAVLALLLFGAVSQTVASHLLAERPFKVAWDRQYVARAIRFGWPLTINGLLMFVILQGDNLLIGSGQKIFGSSYTHADLGVYSVAMMLAMAPTGAVASISSSLMLSVLSRVQDDPVAFERRCRLCVAGLSVASSAFAPILIIAGPSIARLLFGAEYAPIGEVLGILAAMQALRMIRVGPTLAAMSKGDTQTLMITNLIRAMAFAGTVVAVSVNASLVWIAISGLIGEIIALGFALVRLRALHGVPHSASLPGVVIAIIAMLIAGAGYFLLHPLGDLVLLIAGLVLSPLAALANTLALRPTREEIRKILQRRAQERAALGTPA